MAQETNIPKGFIHQKTVGDISEYLLKENGLSVLYLHVPGCDSVTANIVYRVGSRHEARGKTGIAHMFEHMMFKETKDSEGNVTQPPYILLQNKGALLNASTWTDRTNYYFTMPKEYLKDMLLVEANRMRNLVLTQESFTPEQQNVLSEYEMYSERPSHVLSRTVAEHAFISHGYGHETIGHKTDIASLTCDDLQSFYTAYYWPNNAYLAIVGDVERREALEAVYEVFKGIPHSPAPLPEVAVVEPPQEGERRTSIVRPNPLTLLTIAYHAPSARDPLWAAGKVLLSYLTEGKNAPLYKRLIETHMASDVNAELLPSHDPFLSSITATVTKKSTPEKVENIIKEEIEVLQNKTLARKDLLRVQNRLISSTLYSRDGTHDIAQELTEYIALGDWTMYYEILDRIKKVTPQDVREYARTYCRKEKSIIGTFIGTETV